MSVQIGEKSHVFSDPTGLLSDCHRSIEMFLGSLQRLAEIIVHGEAGAGGEDRAERPRSNMVRAAPG